MKVSIMNELLDYKDLASYSPIFIETGSGHGDGIERALRAGFERVLSIEAHDSNFAHCVNRFLNNRKVKLYNGLSQQVLPRILSEQSQPCVIFLDAHPSENFSYGYEQLQTGNLDYGQDSVLRKELKAVASTKVRHIILIDDMNNAGAKLLVEYASIISAVLPNYLFLLYDENLSENGDQRFFYKDKLLLCVPGEL